MTEAIAADLSAPATAPPIPPATLAYRRYALGVLLIVYMLNFLDRQVVNILAEPIKVDLHLKDWQLGAMGGIAFGLFYTFLAIPIARLSERWRRPWVIAGALTLWSGFTAVSGLAQNFTQLCLARLGVGFGEAGCTPAAHSMIADDTPPKDRAFALAFYAMGTPLGGLLGLVIGAVVADAWGWRAAFFVAGAPGLAFALIVALTLKEPRRRILARAAETRAAQATLKETMAYLLRKPTFWLVAFSAAISAFIGYGQAQFTASFFLRTHTVEVAQLGAVFGWKSLTFVGIATGVIGGLAGALGSVLGGKITDWLTAKDLRYYVTVPVISGLLWGPLYTLSVLAPTAKMSLLLGILPSILGTLWYGPVYGVAQGLVPPNMRATTAALLLFIISIIGLGLGPVFTGAVSDYLSAPERLGPAQGVQWALIATAAFFVPSILLSLMARKTVRADLVS
jgi:MFS family permease